MASALLTPSVTPFRCFLCKRFNKSSSSSHAGSCRTCTHSKGITRLCEVCAWRHADNEFPGHDFWFAKDDPPEEEAPEYGKDTGSRAGGAGEEDPKNGGSPTDPKPCSMSHVARIRALHAAFNAVDEAIRSKQKVTVARHVDGRFSAGDLILWSQTENATAFAEPFSAEEGLVTTAASQVIDGFDPGILLTPVLIGVHEFKTFPASTYADLKVAVDGMAAAVTMWDSGPLLSEGPKKDALLAPFLANFQAIEEAVKRALASIEDVPSRLPGIMAELTTASAALVRAVTLGLDFRPAVAREADERHRADASIAALQARIEKLQASLDADGAAKEAALQQLAVAEAARLAEAAAKEAAFQKLTASEAARDDYASSVARLSMVSSEVLELRTKLEALRHRPARKDAVYEAAEKGDAAGIVVHLAMGGSTEEATPDGFTALIAASARGHLEAVKVLVDAGAHVTVKDKAGSTALHWAALHGHGSVVALLLATPGIDPQVKNIGGLTALGQSKNDAVISLLMADPRVED